MLALILLTLAQAPGPSDSRVTRVERVPEGRMPGGRSGVMSYAFFEAFPASGAGTFGVCSTTPPTGSRGEVLTFARASTATCTRTASGGLATTGIQNGDLVTMSAGQPRVEYDSAGTLGLLVESSRINSTLRSEQLDDLAWTLFGSGAAAPTVTANYATAPDGTLTAERLQVAATTLAQRSIIFQASVPVDIRSVYVKGANGTSGVIDVTQDSVGVANNACGCAYNPTTWTRCATRLAATGSFTIGNDGSVNACGSGTRAALDVLVWGAQSETGAYATSYIPTTSAAVTRVAEAASFDGLSLSTAAGVSWAATVQHPSANGGGVWGAGANLVGDASNRTQLYRANTNVQQCDIFSTSGSRSVGTVISAYVAGQAYRQACSYSGAGAASTISNYRDGTLISTSAAGLTSAFTIVTVLPGALGAAATTAPSDGITSRICLDSPSRCR